MKVDGACHCGKVRFRAEIDPDKVFICHCTDCQAISASAFRIAVRTPEEKFELLSGAPKTYVRVADSGRRRAQLFCADCGTHIYATSAEDDGPKLFGLRVSALAERRELPPKRQFWTRSACGWLGELATIEAFELQPPAPAAGIAPAATMTVEGGCHCGDIRYRAAIDPVRVSICHCVDCQAMSSSAFRVSAFAAEADFHLLAGAPRIYIKIAESGNRRAMAFCARCGTQIYATSADGGPKILNLRTGALQQRRALRPIRQIWCRSRLPWVTAIGSIEAHETQ
jgi:hypothetical protein